MGVSLKKLLIVLPIKVKAPAFTKKDSIITAEKMNGKNPHPKRHPPREGLPPKGGLPPNGGLPPCIPGGGGPMCEPPMCGPPPM